MEGLRAEWAVKAIVIIMIGSLILFCCVSAANLTVGGASGRDLKTDLQTWTSHTTFHVGDSPVFNYTPAHDVVEVKEEDYEACDIQHPIKTHNDGETLVPLNQQGRRFFVCGRQGHCSMGLKLEVLVLPKLSRDGGGGGGGGTPKSPLTSSSSTRPGLLCPKAVLGAAAFLIMIIS
ncbi:Phytocyanin domain containing protein [Trema orientale]|uniref:Phytocyanin domain containing protein n=1 Tax=Trema orientale TaxID=63057 RepID=A0A2P5F080_TREOI|nr:Phytocyanin domain containing protein [Trema orientale]